MGSWTRTQQRQLVMGATSIVVLLAGIEIVELSRSHWPLAPAHLLLELVELFLLFAATAALVTTLASRREPIWAPLVRTVRRLANEVRRTAKDTSAALYVTDDQMELLQRLQFYCGTGPGLRIHTTWLKNRCTDQLADRFDSVVAEAKERGLIEDANGWLSLTPAGTYQIERMLFLSPIDELTRRSILPW